MTTKEFSDNFDVLINAQAIQNNFGVTSSPMNLDEYEKSVLLTTAQEEIVRELYNGTFNGDSIEKTEELRRSLDSLIKTDYPDEISVPKKGLDKNSKFYQLKDDVWFITYESVELSKKPCCKDNTVVVKVIPMRQDEWHRSRSNPFRKPNERKVVRLDNGDNISELISEYPIQNYLVRYLSKPTPIILVSLKDEGLFIDKLNEVTECKLNTALHRTILDRAVQLASRRIPSQTSK